MPAKKTAKPKSQRHPFEVIQIRSKGQLLGRVYAANEKEARELAHLDFKIRRPDLVRLIVRKIV
jgi:hypothetical protein